MEKNLGICCQEEKAQEPPGEPTAPLGLYGGQRDLQGGIQETVHELRKQKNSDGRLCQCGFLASLMASFDPAILRAACHVGCNRASISLSLSLQFIQNRIKHVGWGKVGRSQHRHIWSVGSRHLQQADIAPQPSTLCQP